MVLLVEFLVALLAGVGLAAWLEILTKRRHERTYTSSMTTGRRDFDMFLKTIKKRTI